MSEFLKKAWLPFEHQVRQELKKAHLLEKLRGKKILVACSGGADSVALLLFLLRLRKSLSLDLFVLHIHHGFKSNVQFRNEAAEEVKKLAEKWQLPLEKCVLDLGNEKETETLLRQKRIQIYEMVLNQTKSDFLALGHHQDDLLETRLIRMMRGTGGEGLQAMTFLRKKVFRPFLRGSKASLLQYLNEFSIKYSEDPTNQESSNIRNWLRQKWLLPLKKEHPEWHSAMVRSLEQISAALNRPTEKHNFSKGILRLRYDACDSHEQSILLIKYIQSLGLSDFRHSQIKEIQRQLDRSKNVHTFTSAGLVWAINAQQILAKKK